VRACNTDRFSESGAMMTIVELEYCVSVTLITCTGPTHLGDEC